MSTPLVEIKHYKVKSISSANVPNSVFYVKADTDIEVKVYITDTMGVPYPLKDITGTVGGVLSVTNSDGTITTTGSTNVSIRVSTALTTLINSALQAGDAISVLVNDSGFITLADIPAFNPSEYDLTDFMNADADPFARISDLSSGVTNLGYTPSPTNGTVTSDTGTSAIIPLADGTNAGVSLNNYSTAEKTKLSGIATGANVGVVPNSPITGSTKTKITFDSKGLVTAGTDATTADIADTANKRYQTDTQQTNNDATSPIQAQIDSKQTNLVSGSNIKTINSSSLLGSGNLQVGDALITSSITDGDITHSPDGNSVFDALALKQDNITLTTIGSGAATLVGATLNIPTPSASSGTVSTVSVTSANGFAGSVANPTTTPAITLSTTITGVLKGNGTAISAATPGTDYTTPSSTETVTNKNLTSGTNTFPTFNQNTSGSAATLTTPRTIGTLTGDATAAGSGFDGSANNTNAITFATVNSNVGTFGSTSQVPQVTVNAKGLTTAASNIAIQIAESQVTNLVSDLAGKGGLSSANTWTATQTASIFTAPGGTITATTFSNVGNTFNFGNDYLYGTNTLALVAASGNKGVFQNNLYWGQSSGTTTFTTFDAKPIINQTGGTAIIRGFWYHPTLTAIAGENRAIDIESGKIVVPFTNTATGTTGAQTINKISGSVNFGATDTTLVVTNNLVTTTSQVFTQVYGTDATAISARVTKASGSFTITLNAPATAETAVSFWVIN